MKETLASGFEILCLAGTEEFFNSLARPKSANATEFIVVGERELTSLGSVEANNSALAVVKMKSSQAPNLTTHDFSLVLDDIRDPGNLGAIIRTADWFGIRNIIASSETADFYNPKVINATMGSFLRVNVFYTPLEEFVSKTSLPIYGTFLDGEDIHSVKFLRGGLIVVGNESKGISPGIEKRITHRITIPAYGKAESLNASAATAIVLDNLRRQS